MFTLRSHGFIRVRLWKHRWLCVMCGATWQSRPPDEVPGFSVCALLVVMFLWTALAQGREGAYALLPEGAERVAQERTVARWHARACRSSARLEDLGRKAEGERGGPRPEKSTRGKGRSPPAAVLRRGWSDLGRVTQLWRSLVMTFGGREPLKSRVARTLAWARAAADEHPKVSLP